MAIGIGFPLLLTNVPSDLDETGRFSYYSSVKSDTDVSLSQGVSRTSTSLEMPGGAMYPCSLDLRDWDPSSLGDVS